MLFKNKKGSQLVEKILITAFAVAGGGAVIVYTTNVLKTSKGNIEDGFLAAENENGVQLISGKRYKIHDNGDGHRDLEDREWFSVSHIYDENGDEVFKTSESGNKQVAMQGYVGYSSLGWNSEENGYEENTISNSGIFFTFSGTATYDYYDDRQPQWWFDLQQPTLNGEYLDFGFEEGWSFKFSGEYTYKGDEPRLLDTLELID